MGWALLQFCLVVLLHSNLLPVSVSKWCQCRFATYSTTDTSVSAATFRFLKLIRTYSYKGSLLNVKSQEWFPWEVRNDPSQSVCPGYIWEVKTCGTFFSTRLTLLLFHGFEKINECQRHVTWSWEVQSLLDDFLYWSTTLSIYAIMYKHK